jgi:hypothetical protein
MTVQRPDTPAAVLGYGRGTLELSPVIEVCNAIE